MLHTLFAEGLVKQGQAGAYADGLATVKAAVKPFAPAVVAARCGITPDAIARLARELATTPKAAVDGRIGTCTQPYGTLATWLIDLLNILSGHLDEEGGTLFPKVAAFAANTAGPSGKGRGVALGRFSSRVSQAPEVMGEVPIGCMVEEMETPGRARSRPCSPLPPTPCCRPPMASVWPRRWRTST